MSDNVLTQEQRTALKQNFQSIVTGGGKELYILEADFKFEPLGMSPADLQLLESRKFAVQDICRWYGVPSVLVNDTGETTALGSSVHQIIEAFFKLKIGPELELIEGICGKQLFSPAQKAKGYELKFVFDALLRATKKDRFEIYAKGTQNGILTRNECRASEGLPPVEGGDILTAQTNLAPLDMLGQTPATSPPPEQPIEQ